MSLTDEELELLETMSEPPVGYNHGRERGEEGGWSILETRGAEHGVEPSLKHYPPDRWSNTRPITHGTAGAYVKRKCRCDECRAWNTSRKRAERGVATRMDDGMHQ